GAKAGRGFYEKRGDEIFALDIKTLEYRPPHPVKLPSLDAARSIESTAERLATLYRGQDNVGAFLRSTLGPALDYADRIADLVAYSRADVDNAMKWGFGWEIGPLATLAALQLPTPQLRNSQETTKAGNPGETPKPPKWGQPQLTAKKGDSLRIVRKNAGASLIDLGDGVLQIEFHSKMNAIGGDTMQMLQAGVREASQNFAAIVVGNDGINFSAGANLMLLLLEAQEGNW